MKITRILKDFDLLEVSFVYWSANPHARIMSIEEVTDEVHSSDEMV